MWNAEEKLKVRTMVLHYADELRKKGFPVKPIVGVKFGKRVRTFGTCHHYRDNTCEITIDYICYCGGDTRLKQTIIHELCHACCEIGEGHGRVWKSYAENANIIYKDIHITRCTNYNEAQKAYAKTLYKYTAKCDKCGAIWHYMRKTQFVKDIEKNHAETWTCKCG